MKKVLGLIVTLGLILALAACTTGTVTITFDVNGGSAVDSMTVTGGEMITEPTEPTKLGYVFSGWYADEALSDEFNFTSDAVDAELTLYAKWVQDAVTFSGADNEDVDFQGAFNVLDGVTATGSTGIDYTDYITYSTISAVDEDDNLDTTLPGNKTIQYEVKIDTLILGQKFRTITVASLEKQEGDMLVNADFSAGIAGWDTFSADGSSIVLSTEEFDGNPALKVEVVAGANLWTPRFTQMNVEFVEDTTYEITFRAKSSVAKTINLQVGEILTVAPWFTDFKPGLSITKDITTEWATYSYKFTMNQGDENFRGGILFELGTFPNEDGVDATMWFDDITIEVSTADPDETAPIFSGANETARVYIDTVYNPLDGVTALDAVDGDLTDSIVVEIKDASDQVVTAVDTSVEGTYTITYTVEDEAGNIAMTTTTLSVVEAPQDTYALPNWRMFINNWEGSAGTLYGQNGQLVLMIENANFYQPWTLQLIQDAFSLGTGADNIGSFQLEAGATYRITFDAKASIAGDFTFLLGESGSTGNWVEYYSESLAATTAMQTFTVDVTLDAEGDYTQASQFKLELGGLFNTAVAGDYFLLDNVTFQKLDTDGETYIDTDFIVDGDFSKIEYNVEEWRTFVNNWEGSAASLSGVNGELVLMIESANFYQPWTLQLIQDAFSLGTGADNIGSFQLEAGATYRITFDAKASIAGDFTFLLGESGSTGNWVEYYSESLAATTAMQTFTVDVTLDAEGDYTQASQFKLELGGLFNTAVAGDYFVLDNVTFQKLDTDGETYIDTDFIVNGNIDRIEYNVEEWRTFVNNWEGSAASLSGVNGELVLMIESANFYQPWTLQLIQDAFSLGTGADNIGSFQLEAGATYRITFDAKASIAGDFTFLLGESGSTGNWVEYYSEALAATTAMQTFTVDVTLDAEGDYTQASQFKLELGGLFNTAVAGDYFVLDNVTFQKLDTDGETYIDTDFIVNGLMNPAVVE